MSNSQTPTPDNAPTMSKEDIAYFIRTMWEALLKPSWDRSDLIDLGMAVFAKTTLSKMDQKKLGRLLPSLSIVASEMGEHVRHKFESEFKTLLEAQEVAHHAALATAQASFEALLDAQETVHQTAIVKATVAATASAAPKPKSSSVVEADPVTTTPTTDDSTGTEQPTITQDLTGGLNGQ
jgi:hypothetical protein